VCTILRGFRNSAALQVLPVSRSLLTMFSELVINELWTSNDTRSSPKHFSRNDNTLSGRWKIPIEVLRGTLGDTWSVLLTKTKTKTRKKTKMRVKTQWIHSHCTVDFNSSLAFVFFFPFFRGFLSSPFHLLLLLCFSVAVCFSFTPFFLLPSLTSWPYYKK